MEQESWPAVGCLASLSIMFEQFKIMTFKDKDPDFPMKCVTGLTLDSCVADQKMNFKLYP